MDSKLKVIGEYRLHYHAMPPYGWINDPNGFCHFNGAYHLYAQHHPYSSQWGPMHWGHWQSDDLVHWDWRGVAMAPDQPFDSAGCFSGTALCDDGQLILMYTGVTRNESGTYQNQCVARSDDGHHVAKFSENPVISEKELPKGASAHDFRDPKLYKTKEGYMAIVASRGDAGGQLLSFSSTDLKNWVYRDVFFKGIGDMPECPDYFEMDGQGVLISCVMNMPPNGLDYPNTQPAVYMLGKANDERTVFTAQKPVALDYGLDYYAPQTAQTPDGRRVIIAWMHSWAHISPTHYLSHGWSGAMTLVREVRIKDGRLIQTPAREIERYQGPWRVHPDATDSVSFSTHASARVRITIRDIAAQILHIKLMHSGDEYFLVTYAPQTGVLTVDRSKCGHTMGPNGEPEKKPYSAGVVPLTNGALKLDIFLDTCSVEIFANDGRAVFTSLAFPRHHGTGVEISAPSGSAAISAEDCEIVK